MQSQTKILWKPDEQSIQASNLKAYENWLEKKRGLRFDSGYDLWQWSVDHIDAFWESIWAYFEIINHARYTGITSSGSMPGVRWFTGARINYAEHVFRHKSGNRDALIFVNESQQLRIGWEQLEREVLAIQNHLKSAGIGKGDRVAAYLPNIPEAIVAFLAVNSLGAVWTCCSPDFGVSTVVERFEQVEPKLIIGVDGYSYNNRKFDRKGELLEICQSLPSAKKRVLVSYLDTDSRMDGFDAWSDILEVKTAGTLEFEPVEFNHPIWVLYSSGTTGKPKAITHSHGGVLLEHLKYMSLHNDVKKGENFFWFTTTGWMMWNFLQASMLVGATPVLYDGSPGYPDLEALWKLAEELPIHHFGTSAPYLTACMKEDLNISRKYRLEALRSIGSTGAPLPDTAFEWVYSNVSENVWLCSMSGGTDVCTAFVGGHPYYPVRSGRIQARALGCAMYAYDDQGSKVYDSLGEMVIEKPMPSMPIKFWNDDQDRRYRSSYFEKYPGKWCHGDWINLYSDGSLSIHGRSDATLNRKGVRIGTAEIYKVLTEIPSIKDALVLNIEKRDGSDFMPLFIVLNEGYALDHGLKTSINSALKKHCSPRHVPDEIFQVGDVPYTLSGKKMEVPLKKMFMGMATADVMNKDAMRNPESLEEYGKLVDQISQKP